MKHKHPYRFTRLGCALTLFTMLAALCLPAFAAQSDTPQTAQITGTIVWDDEENAGEQRPQTVTVSLLADGEKVDETTASSDWTFSFSVPLDSIGSTAYTVSAAADKPYAEDTDAHTDPVFLFDYPSGAEWTKYEPCNELAIPDSVLGGTIIAGKMTANRPFTVWSTDALSELEQTLVRNSLKNIPGVGNPREFVFISGDGASVNGMTVKASEGTVLFDRPSNWALLFGGEYARGEYNSLDSRITFRLEEADLPLMGGPVGTDTVVDPQPTLDPEPILDPQPTVIPDSILPPGAILDPAPVRDPEPAVDPEPVFGNDPIVDPEPVFGSDPIADPVPAGNFSPDIVPAPVTPVEVPIRTVSAPVAQHVLDAQPKTGVPAVYVVLRAAAAVSLLALIVCCAVWHRKSDPEV